MRMLRIAGYALMALVLAAGWAFLYWQSGLLDFAALEGARGGLAELRAIDARWNDQLIGTRLRQASPRAVQAPARHASAHARLEVNALRLGSPALGAGLAGLKLAFADKAALLERFARVQAERAALEAREDKNEARLAELRALGEALFDQAWLASTGPRLELVARALERAYDDAAAQADLYRVWLLYYSGFLLAVLAFLAWSLDQRRRQIDRIARMLREANETLEARVLERTRELSQALARLKESEAMLVQSEKMSSLGQMVAGLVHEVNTPLAYVKASLEGVRKRMPDFERLAAETARLLELLSAEGADEARLAAQFAAVRASVDALQGSGVLEDTARQVQDGAFGIGQISELVASLKDFSRLDRSRVAEFDLHEGLEASIRIAQHQLKHRELRREFGPIPRVSCSPSQINQVFLNLLTNAAQATPEKGGAITVRTGMRDAAHVAVEVADNGHGIPPEVLPRIFDPFFTTKPVGQGTGLGLAVSYKIVESHGGRLEVQSRPGAGTRFTVLLPLKPPATLAA